MVMGKWLYHFIVLFLVHAMASSLLNTCQPQQWGYMGGLELCAPYCNSGDFCILFESMDECARQNFPTCTHVTSSTSNFKTTSCRAVQCRSDLDQGTTYRITQEHLNLIVEMGEMRFNSVYSRLYVRSWSIGISRLTRV